MTRNIAQVEDAKAIRRSTNLSLDASLVDEARLFGINLSRACEQGLAVRIAEERARRWRSENAAAIASSNAFVEEKGLPLADLRPF
ncbi:MAG: post-segregation antitoxin CcdA [Alphaproteobacteria bacterium]|nr:post-segregation antitoxin CcdA [Alphaproteobacteria bacterium]